MIYFFTPYSYEIKLLDAIAGFMNLLLSDDWAVHLDGDTLFLQPDFGNQIQQHIISHPEAGLFTCYASRCHYSFQVPQGVDMENDSIGYHKLIASYFADTKAGQVKEIKRRIAGHLMVIRKSTWTRLLPDIVLSAAGKKILGVDTKISKAVLAAGLKILLMENIYLLHYCWLKEGFEYTKHLT
jgi:GT2 family glycosyltransferase